MAGPRGRNAQLLVCCAAWWLGPADGVEVAEGLGVGARQAGLAVGQAVLLFDFVDLRRFKCFLIRLARFVILLSLNHRNIGHSD